MNWLLILGLVALTLAPIARADVGSGNWRHLSPDTEPAMQSGDVRAVAFAWDAQGIPTLWVGTAGGLQRFDGRDWQTVAPAAETAAQAAAERLDVWALAHDAQGSLWIGSGSGVQQRDAQGNWASWPPKEGGPPGRVDLLAPLADGRVLAAVQDEAAPDLWVWNPVDKEWSALGLEAGPIHDVLVADDAIWLATDAGALPLDPQTLARQTARGVAPQDVDLEGAVRALARQKDGKLWLGMDAGLLGVPAGAQKAPSTWELFGPGQPGLADPTVNDLLLDRDGTLWVATDDGLSHYDPAHRQWRRYFQEQDGLLSDRVRRLFLDGQGTLWVITDGGVSGLDRTWGDFLPANTAPTDFIGANDMRALWGDGRGTVWVGMNGGGVSLSSDGGAHWTTLSSANSGLPDDRVLSLWGDGHGVVWIGTERGLIRWSRDGVGWTLARAHDSLPIEPIYALWGSDPDTIWAGTASGLFYSTPDKEDPARLTWERYSGAPEALSLATSEQPAAAAAIAGTVQALWGDGRGELWVGTNEGLYALGGDPHSTAPRLFTTADGLPDNDIRALGGRAGGRPWVGTRLGLGRPDADDESWTAITADSTEGAFPSNLIHAVWLDAQGRVWAGTENGLALSSDGETWFTTLSGAIKTVWGDGQGQMWAGGLGKMAYSPNAGSRWVDYTTLSQAATGLRSPLVRDVHHEPAGDTLWAATETDLSNSSDGGQTWHTSLSYRALGLGAPLALDSTRQGTLWVVGALGVAYSENQGRFIKPTQPEGGRINDLWIQPGEASDTVWLGTGRGLYRSDDGGDLAWQFMPPPERLAGQAVRALTGQGDVVWMGLQNGFLARLQDGRNWLIVDDFASETIHDIWVQDEQVAVATERGIHHSDDGGFTWQLINAADGLPDNDVQAIYFHPVTGEIWLGTASGGLTRSDDGGTTWRAVNRQDNLPPIRALTSAGQRDSAMWVATDYGLIRYAPNPETQPWVRLLQVSDGQETFNRPQEEVDEVKLTTDQQLDVQFVGGSLIARPETVRYTTALESQEQPALSFPTQDRNPAGADSVARVSFATAETERLDGDYRLSIVAIDHDGRRSSPRTLKVIAPATALEKAFKWLKNAIVTFIRTFLLSTLLVLALAWAALWSLSRSIGIPSRVLLRQRARIPIVSLGYRDYRHRWEEATPLERLLALLAPPDHPFTQAEAAGWLQEQAIPVGEETLGRTLQGAVRDDLLRREGNRYSLAEKALNQALQDHEGQIGLEKLMRQVRETHPLVAQAHNLFAAAGFTLQDVDEPLSFLCQPAISFWTRRLQGGIYTRVLPNLPLDREAVNSLYRQARATPEAGPVAFVILDTHPDDSGWDAIGELRATGFTIVPIDDHLIHDWQIQRREQHELADHLDRFTDPDYDPYVMLTSASGALGYFGHRDLAQRLLKRIEQGQATALLGLRKMGTSSTLRYLQDEIRWPTALVDLQATPDLAIILASALQDWIRSAQRKLDLNWGRFEPPTPLPSHAGNGTGDPTTDFLATVTRMVQVLRATLGAPSARLVLMLDEIELVVPRSDANDAKLTRYLALARLLKGLVQDGLLSLMVAGNDSQFNRVSLWGEHANPFYQLFQEQFLPPLSPQECGYMVQNIGRQIGLTYDQETLDFIAQASGGHPYLARQLCSLTYQALDRTGAVPLDLVRQTAERFVRNPRTAAFLDDNGLWGYLGQPDLWGLVQGRANQAVLIDLAASPQPLTAEALKEGPNSQARAGAVFALRERWVIRPADPDASPPAYGISFGLFADWIALNRDKESPKLQLQQHAQEFLTNSDFQVKPLEEKGYTPWDFLSVPDTAGWRARFSHPVYTAIVARQALDDQAVLAIRQAALKHSPGSGVAFAVIDQHPDDAAWLQIATLRAGGFSLVLLPDTLLQDGRAKQKERRLLLSHLDRALGRGYNPYDVRSPVYDVLNFFGRQALADQMTARLSAAQPLALFGLRKMGKSSMLYYLRNHVPFPVALVDLQSETELRAIYHEILRGWSRSLYVKFDFDWPIPALPESSGLRDLPLIFRDITTNLLETLGQLTPEPRLGVFLDEIEQIVPRPDETGRPLQQYLAFMRGLRGIIQETKQLALLVTGVDPAINRVSRYVDEQNPAFQLFQEIFLPPLTFEDCGQMVRNIGRQVGLRFPQTAIDVVNEASGGHPFLARQLCSRAYNELERAGQLTGPLMRETVDTFIRNPQTAANLDERGMWGEVTRPALWGREIARANQQILKRLAAVDDPLEREEILRDEDENLESALFALENRWVLRQTRRWRKSSLYQITFGLFQRWIRRHFGLGEKN